MDAAAATLQGDLSEALPAQDDYLPEGRPHTLSDATLYCIGAAGILRYKRELDHRINLATILPAQQPMTEHPVKCEYCGDKARPSLDLSWDEFREKGVHFCCAQRRQLYEMLEKDRSSVGGRYGLMDNGASTSLGDESAADTEDHLLQAMEMDDPNKFIKDLPCGFGELPKERIFADISFRRLPMVGTSSKVLSFRLSRASGKGCWTAYPRSTAEQYFKRKEEEEELLGSSFEHKPLQFGMCNYQDGLDFLQRNYSSGIRFLSAFSDGSAQLFYPSGLLAIVVMVTEDNGRACIVYDDSNTPCGPIRAVFQSDDRAMCYHSNGNLWLNLNRSGGQCMSQLGTTIRQWMWSNLSNAPTPQHPVLLSLNKNVRVHILGRDQVFISFLARGEEVKLNVSSSSHQVKH